MTLIPERIEEEARACLTGCVIAFNNQSEAEKLVSSIAAALLAAEQRGREMEREECARIAEGGWQDDGSFIFAAEGEGIADTIRSRSEQGKGE